MSTAAPLRRLWQSLRGWKIALRAFRVSGEMDRLGDSLEKTVCGGERGGAHDCREEG